MQLDAAESARDRVRALTGTVKAYEAGLAAMRGETTPLTPREWVRFVLRTLGILLGLLVSVPLHYLYRVFAYGSPFPMLFLRYTAWIIGARVKIHGTPLRRDVFFIANHVSWVDILALAGASGTAFVAKAELAKAPLVGWLCSLNRTVFVQREDRLRVADQINARFERVFFSDNYCLHVAGDSNDNRATVDLVGRGCTVTGNQVKATNRGFFSFNFNGMRGPFADNVTSGGTLGYAPFAPAPDGQNNFILV